MIPVKLDKRADQAHITFRTGVNSLYEDISVRVQGIVKPILYLGGTIAKLAIIAAIKLPIAFVAEPIIRLAGLYVGSLKSELKSDKAYRDYKETFQLIAETNKLSERIKKVESDKGSNNEISMGKAQLAHLKREIDAGVERIQADPNSKSICEYGMKRDSDIKWTEFLIESIRPNTFAGLKTDLEMIGSYFGEQTINSLKETASGQPNKSSITVFDALGDTLSLLAGDYHDIEIKSEIYSNIMAVHKTEAAQQRAFATERMETWLSYDPNPVQVSTINPSPKKVTIRGSEAKANPMGQSPRSTRGAPLPKARATREIDVAKPLQADCHLFGARVNKDPFQEFNEKTHLTDLSKEIKGEFARFFNKEHETLDESLVSIGGEKIPSGLHRDATGGLPTIKYNEVNHVSPSIGAPLFDVRGRAGEKLKSCTDEEKKSKLTDFYKKALSPIIDIYDKLDGKNEDTWYKLLYFIHQGGMIGTGIIGQKLSTFYGLDQCANLDTKLIRNNSRVVSYNIQEDKLNISVSQKLFLANSQTSEPLTQYATVKINFAFNLNMDEPVVTVEPVALFPISETVINEATTKGSSLENVAELSKYAEGEPLPDNVEI